MVPRNSEFLGLPSGGLKRVDDRSLFRIASPIWGANYLAFEWFCPPNGTAALEGFLSPHTRVALFAL